jgi:uridine phosphorylase
MFIACCLSKKQERIKRVEMEVAAYFPTLTASKDIQTAAMFLLEKDMEQEKEKELEKAEIKKELEKELVKAEMKLEKELEKAELKKEHMESYYLKRIAFLSQRLL